VSVEPAVLEITHPDPDVPEAVEQAAEAAADAQAAAARVEDAAERVEAAAARVEDAAEAEAAEQIVADDAAQDQEAIAEAIAPVVAGEILLAGRVEALEARIEEMSTWRDALGEAREASVAPSSAPLETATETEAAPPSIEPPSVLPAPVRSFWGRVWHGSA